MNRDSKSALVSFASGLAAEGALRGIDALWSRSVLRLPFGVATLVIGGFVWFLLRRTRPLTSSPLANAPQELTINLNRVAQDSFDQNISQLIDRVHLFGEIEARYRANRFDGNYQVQYRGKNKKRVPSAGFMRLLAGDSATTADQLKFEVSDEDGKQLHWQFEPSIETPFRKVFRVWFREPIKKNEPFFASVTATWPGTFARRDDYVFFPCHHFKQGIERLHLCVVLPTKPAHYQGITWKRGRPRLATHQPTLSPVEDGYEISVVLTKPRTAYSIWFTRSDI